MYRSQKKQPDRRNYTRLWCGAHPPLPPTQRVLVKWSPIDATKMYQSKKQFLHLRLRSFLVGGPPPTKITFEPFYSSVHFEHDLVHLKRGRWYSQKKIYSRTATRKTQIQLRSPRVQCHPQTKKRRIQQKRLTIKVPVSLLAIY